MLSSYSLKMLLEQSILTIISGCGVLFVVAQGSIDLTVGVNVALSGVVAMHVAQITGIGWLMIPVALLIGLLMGCSTVSSSASAMFRPLRSPSPCSSACAAS
jgi:ribose transport system permease protein